LQEDQRKTPPIEGIIPVQVKGYGQTTEVFRLAERRISTRKGENSAWRGKRQFTGSGKTGAQVKSFREKSAENLIDQGKKNSLPSKLLT